MDKICKNCGHEEYDHRLSHDRGWVCWFLYDTSIENGRMGIQVKSCHELLELKPVKYHRGKSTSLNIDEDLWLEVRIAAMKTHMTATEFVEKALKNELAKVKK